MIRVENCPDICFPIVNVLTSPLIMYAQTSVRISMMISLSVLYIDNHSILRHTSVHYSTVVIAYLLMNSHENQPSVPSGSVY